MSRTIQGLLALALFIGVGYFTRHYFREWLPGAMKDAEAASARESAKWKSAAGKFDNGIKLDKPINTIPKVNLPPNGPKPQRGSGFH